MSGNYSVLILGGGIMQIPAITLAKKMGMTVIVADGNPDVIGAQLADHFEHIDLKDRERMLSVAKTYRDSGRLDGVFTAGTDFSATVAFVAENLGLPGIPFETAMNATDKGRMRKVLKAGGVPCPEYTVVASVEDIPGKTGSFSFPLVVKPVDNMGSRGVRRVDTQHELEDSVRSALPLSRTSRVIVEEYIDGPEFSIDALVYHGEIFICGFADRHIFFPPYFVEMGHTIPSCVSDAVREEILEVFRRGVRALGIHDGAAKGDVKYSSRGPVIGEIAARLSGGYMSGWTFPYSSGVHVTAGGLRIALGFHPGSLEPVQSHVSAERAFISIPGIVRSVHGLEEARSVPHVRELFSKVKEGSRVVFPMNNVEKCGNVLSESETRAGAIAASETACRKILIRLEPEEESTQSYLFFSPAPYPPPAFTLERKADIEALSRMPSAILPADPASVPGIAIIPLPAGESESSRDWHGVPFAEALAAVLRITGVQSGNGESGEGVQLGSLFWNAFLKGGIQGGVWIIDTVRHMLQKGSSVPSFTAACGLPEPVNMESRSMRL